MMSLDELSSQVARQLADRGLLGAAPDARVAAAPDARTVRYYTTLGLLDRPKLESRQARYSERHLLQLLAIKALQAFQLPLAEIQHKLYGLGNEQLRHVVDAFAAQARAIHAQIPEAPPALTLREILLEPGLRLQIEEGWTPRDPAALEQRIRAAVAALYNGGRK